MVILVPDEEGREGRGEGRGERGEGRGERGLTSPLIVVNSFVFSVSLTTPLRLLSCWMMIPYHIIRDEQRTKKEEKLKKSRVVTWNSRGAWISMFMMGSKITGEDFLIAATIKLDKVKFRM